MENVLQKIGKFLGEKFALIDEKFAKKTELQEEKERAEQSEKELSENKINKEEGKQLMPSPSQNPDPNKYLGEDGTWKTINLDAIEQNITSLEENYKSADNEISQQLTAEIARAKQAENAKVNKVEGKELMPSPSATPGTNKFLSEEGMWKEIDLTEINGSISGLEEADTELNRKLNEEISRAKEAEAEKVDKIQGKGLSANDYTSGEKNKLGNIGPYINDISTSYNDEHSLAITAASKDPQTGTNSEKSILIPEAGTSNNGLMSSLHYGIVDGLGKDSIYMDAAGTPSHTWQLSKTSGNYTGPLIKNSGGVLELRTGTDDAYTDLILKDIVIKGNVTQEGSSFITNAETVETADNTILLNKGEVAAGVTKGHAGIEIDRGTLPMYKIYFDESDDRFKAGSGTDLWPIMLRDEESTLTDESTLIWDATNKRAKAGKNLDTELAKYLPLKGGKVSGPIQMTNTSIKFVNKSNKIIGALTPHVGDEGFQITALNGPITFATDESMVHFINSAYHKIWDEANDGEGSGLDADMLDGKHASEFASSVEGGYLPLSGGELTGNLVIPIKMDEDFNSIGIKSNNGNIISRDGILLNIGDTKNGGVYINCNSSASIYAQKGLHTYEMWHEGNDGDNSGLDADLLDGRQGSEYALKSEIGGLGSVILVFGVDVILEDGVNGTMTDEAYTKVFDAIGKNKSVILTMSQPGEGTANTLFTTSSIVESNGTIVGIQLIAGQNMANGDVMTFAAMNFTVAAGLNPDGLHPLFYGNGSINFHTSGSGNRFLNDQGSYSAIDFTNINSNIGLTDGKKIILTYSATTFPPTGMYLSKDGNQYGMLVALADTVNIGDANLGLSFMSKNEPTLNGQKIATINKVVTLDDAQTIIGSKTFTAAVSCSAGFYDTSDIRLKSNIKPIELKPAKINLYEFDKNGNHSFGVIAQEIEKSYPSTVRKNEDGYKMVNYNEVLTIKCAELEKRIDALESKLIN